MRLGVGAVVALILNARIAVVIVIRVRVNLKLGRQQTGLIQLVPVRKLLIGGHLAAILLIVLLLVVDGLHLLVHFETYRIKFVKGLLEEGG